MEDRYLAARFEGREPRDAARIAGYSENTKINEIERVGGPVDRKLQAALQKARMDEEWLVGEYEKGIEKVMGADPNFDGQAHAKYLLQLSYLMGHGKRNTPAVAVQINNQPGGKAGCVDGDDPERLADLISETRNLLEDVRAVLRQNGPGDVHEGDSALNDAGTHPGVDTDSPVGEDDDSRGGA